MMTKKSTKLYGLRHNKKGLCVENRFILNVVKTEVTLGYKKVV